jgi:hypothetical protein
MDPNETLKALRGDVAAFLADQDPDDARLVVERFEELDAWLSRGGFLPAAWSR